MKLFKITSLVTAAAMAVSAASMIFLPAAFAATDEETLSFNENFEDMELTSTAGAEATMQTLFDDGWYPVDNNKSYTADATQSIFQFATVMGDDSNHFLRINTPKSSSANAKYGLGRLFPGQGTNAKGVWEINFRFMPYYKTTTPVQFNFGLNTYGANVDETVAQHNIISAYDNKMYMGYRDYLPLYEGAGVPQGRIDGTLPLDWYDVKVIVNCDVRYYSVELSHDGELFARRSAISFAGDETIGFFKMSALGMGKPAAVYVDDISIHPAERETLIYNEDFEAFSEVVLTKDGMTTGGETEDVAGHSYFGGFTPWRAHKEVGNYYDLEIDPDLLSQVVRLGSDTVGSGLVYMPAFEKLVDAATQSSRGMVRLSFKMKPDNIGAASVTVNAIADHTQTFNDNRAKMFMISNKDGSPSLAVGEDNYVALDPSHWYDVDMVFDVINKKVSADVTDINTSETVSYSRNSVLTALKGIMFTVPAGSSVLADDINIEYYAPRPEIDESKIVLTDKDGNEVADKNNAPVDLQSIKIPVGCTVNPLTASAETIKLRDGSGNEIQYDPSRLDNAYTLILKETLEENQEYTVTIPSTLANAFGDELGYEYTFTFSTSTGSSEPASGFMRISAVKIGGGDIASLEDIVAGSPIDIITDYSNKTEEAMGATGIVAFYGKNGGIVKVLTDEYFIEPGASATGDLTFAITVPSDINMANISKVSVFLWDGFDNINPYCPKVSFE